MPFNFLRRGGENRRGSQDSRPGVQSRGPRSGVPFDGLTEDWRLIGTMQIEGRLSDVLNRREAIPIADVSWAPVDGSAGFTPVPGLKSIDPYDLIVVLAGEGTLPPLSETERQAHRVHKVAYDVALDASPFRIVGRVYLHPGAEPSRLLDRSTELFVPVIDAILLHGDRRVGVTERDAILVNRSYLKGVEQIDRRSFEARLASESIGS